MAQVKALVQKLIQENAVMVFSKSYCPYCVRAKQLLSRLKIPFEAVELDQRQDGSAIQSYLEELTNQRTVPNIFIHQKHVGGCDSIHALNDRNELVKLYEQGAK